MSSSTAKCHQVAQRTHPWQHLLRASILCNNRPRIFQYSTSTGALTVLPTTTHPKRYIICVYARPRPQPPSACKHPNFQRPSFLPSNSRSVASTGTSPPPPPRGAHAHGQEEWIELVLPGMHVRDEMRARRGTTGASAESTGSLVQSSTACCSGS